MRATVIWGNPGCGKTRTLVELAKNYAEQGSRVTFLSFTKAAAAEALRRVDHKLISPSTIHSLAFGTLGLSRNQVVDWRKLKDLSQATGVPFKRRADDDEVEGDLYLGVLSYASNLMIAPDEAYDRLGRPGTTQQFTMFRRAYSEWKSTYGFVDYDDMLKKLVEFDRMPKWPVVMLDEAQDSSPLQWRAFDCVIKQSDNVIVCGDPDQAIFEWSGADPQGMGRFMEKYSAQYRHLEQSHRVPDEVARLAHRVLDSIEHRLPKKFTPRRAEGSVSWFGDLQFMDKDKIREGCMIMVRDRFHRLEAERWLNSNLIPYRINGGESPFTNKWAGAIRAIAKLNEKRQLSRDERWDLESSDLSVEDLHARVGQGNTLDWRDILAVPGHLRFFYEDADIVAPIKVTLSTIHQAKGHEHPRVVVNLGMTERVYHQSLTNRDAEARVWYVAITRSADELLLYNDNDIVSPERV